MIEWGFQEKQLNICLAPLVSNGALLCKWSMVDMLGVNCTNVITPCIGQCDLDKNDICMGCYRSALEISSWMNKSEDEKIDIAIRCKKKIARNL